MIGCVAGAQKCCNGVVAVCVGIEIALIYSCLMYFGTVRFGGDTSYGVVFCGVCIFCLIVAIILFNN